MLFIYLSMIDDPKDKSKFIELHEKYKYMIFGISFSILKNAQDAEDAAQETFMKVAKNIYKIDKVSCRKTETFLVILCRNTSIDLYRKNRQEQGNIEFDENNDMDNMTIGITPDILNEIISKEGYQRLLALIEEMSDTYKDVIKLKFVVGMSNDEIAESLKITKKNVEVRILRGRTMLIKMLKKEGYHVDI
jgi:RNA polymerase sigma-70 factor (ECF subfamily)